MIDFFTPKVIGALQRHKWFTKSLKSTLLPEFQKELDKEHCVVYCYRLKGDLFLIHQPSLDDTDQAYMAYLNWGVGNTEKGAELKKLIDLNKVEIDGEWTLEYKHPYIPGQESLNWDSLLCSGCGRPNDDCYCCDTCGYDSAGGNCECSFCSHCGENIDAGECHCVRCDTCEQLIEDCDCEQPEDLPSVNDGPGDGPQFA